MLSSCRIAVKQSMRIRFQKLSSQATPATSFRYSSTTRHDDLEIRSARAQFKQLPVNQSILKYIKSVGVGIPSKKRRRRRNGRSNDDRVLLTAEEEHELFQHRSLLAHRNPPKRQIPPLPFTTNLRSRTYIADGKTVEILPVKRLASSTKSNNEDEDFPKASPGLPEVAIAGRSNVGKSTLLNALLYGSQPSVEDDGDSHQQRPSRRRKPKRQTAKLPRGLKAVASARPGETRTISFYQLSAKIDKIRASLLLVDLPGYGFAFAGNEAMEKWQTTMQRYLIGRGNGLKRILLLIDSRHGMKSADVEFLDSLQQALQDHQMNSNDDKRLRIPPIQIVLTKCDLVNQSDLARRVEMVRRQLSDSLRRQSGALPIMLVSAQIEGQAGLIELQRELAALVPVQTVLPTTAPIQRTIDDASQYATKPHFSEGPRNRRPPQARRNQKLR